jgi:hypothetical protein
MIIEFYPETHTYYVDGDVAQISVTALLSKHGLSPNYSEVPKETLKAAAARGTAVHEDIENYLNTKDYTVQTPEGLKFVEWADENLDCATAEQMLAFDYAGMWLAGTADIMGYLKDGTPFIADHKTTATLHTESVAWQTSILDYMARHLGKRTLNGKRFKWAGAAKLFCFWYHDGELTVKELERVDDEEIEKLFNAEYNGKTYQRASLVVESELKAQVEQAEQELVVAETAYKAVQARAKELREKLCEEMKRQKIKSWETDKLKITLVAPQERVGLDSDKVKKEYPQVYAACQKLTQVKATVRVTVKKEKDEK